MWILQKIVSVTLFAYWSLIIVQSRFMWRKPTVLTVAWFPMFCGESMFGVQQGHGAKTWPDCGKLIGN